MNIAASDISPARRSGRRHVLLTAVLITSDGQHAVRIRDLSSEGVNVAWDHLPLPAGDVIFKKGEIFAAARVAWVRPGDVGLEFYRPLDPGSLPGG